MIRWYAVLIFVFFVFCHSLGWAELYKYYDDNGIVCFTNDISAVPEDQRVRIEFMHEVQEQQWKRKTKDLKSSADISLDNDVENQETLKQTLDRESRKLAGIKMDLDKEYAGLKSRRDELLSVSQNKPNSRTTEEYNKQATILNRDSLKYKEKKADYLKRVKEYNLKLESVF